MYTVNSQPLFECYPNNSALPTSWVPGSNLLTPDEPIISTITKKSTSCDIHMIGHQKNQHLKLSIFISFLSHSKGQMLLIQQYYYSVWPLYLSSFFTKVQTTLSFTCFALSVYSLHSSSLYLSPGLFVCSYRFILETV